MIRLKRLWLAAVLTLCVGATASAYNLTVGTSEYGTLTFLVDGTATTSAQSGQTVTVSIKPDADYAVETVTARAYSSWEAARSRRRAPALVKDIALTGSDTQWTLLMPEANVEVSVTFRTTRLHYAVEAEDSESGKDVSGVTLTMQITDEAAKAATVDRIVIPGSLAGEPLTVHIPATAGSYAVTGIAAGAIAAGSNVTDVWLPATERPLTIAEGALPATAVIHSPLALLDDYALMASLSENYEAVKVMTTVEPANAYWTLSCGVDVVLPEGLKPHIVYTEGAAIRMVPISSGELQLAGGRVGIKANNGVLLIGQKGVSYDLVASPGHQRSGTVPATTNARSYGAKNQLEPVIERRNFAAGSYLVLKDNHFHSIKANASRVKACKAVLRVK